MSVQDLCNGDECRKSVYMQLMTLLCLQTPGDCLGAQASHGVAQAALCREQWTLRRSESPRGRSRGCSRHRKRRRRISSSSSSYTTYSRSSPSIFRRRGRRKAGEDSEYSYSESASRRNAEREKETKAQKPAKGSEKPKAAEKPKTFTESKTLDRPKASAKPKASEKPKASAKPKAPEKPKTLTESKTPEPKALEKPKTSEKPMAPEKPKTPEKPKAVAKSKVAQKRPIEKQKETEKTNQKDDAKGKTDQAQGSGGNALPPQKKLKVAPTAPKMPEKAEEKGSEDKTERGGKEDAEKALLKTVKQASKSPNKSPKSPKSETSLMSEKSPKCKQSPKSETNPKSEKSPKSPKVETNLESPPDADKIDEKPEEPVPPKTEEKVSEKNGKPKEELLGKGGLDTLALQRSLSQDTQNLQLMLLQAKRDLDDRRDTLEKQERREKEYYRGDYGEPLGPENRLLLEEALGQGAFSTVYRCRDMKAEGERFYAVKLHGCRAKCGSCFVAFCGILWILVFIRKNSVLRTATEQEVKLMRRLRTQASELDPVGARCFLGLAGPEVIEHEGHLALCFQLQRCDLRSALKRWGQGAGLPLGLVRNYARNIFLALRALKLVNIVHSDLKPDNLLVSMDKMSVKLSDFGSAMDVKDRLRPEKAAESLQPRFYRAPEVILGQPYDTQIDVWSAGCTVFEMVTGRFLFTGRDNNDMLFRIMKQLGAFSRKFVGSGKLSDRHFRREDGAFRCGADANGEPLKFIGREDFPRPPRPIMEELKEPLQLESNGDAGQAGQVAAKALVELILGCITPDPRARLDPDAALSTCFLRPSGNRVQ
eukprot:s125_g4.t1